MREDGPEALQRTIKSVVERYQKANRKEQKPLSAEKIMQLIRAAIGDVDISQENMEAIMNRLLKEHSGEPLKERSPTAKELGAAARRQYRKKMKKYLR